MESYLPVIHYLREISLHYKSTGNIPKSSENVCTIELEERSLELPKTSSAETDKKFVCLLCCRKFLAAHNLRNHLKNFHIYPKFKCSYCPFKSDRKAHFIRHEREHTRVVKPKFKPVECCGFFFKSKTNLKKHKTLHCRLLKAFKCHLCQEKLENQEALDLHRSNIHHFSGQRWSCMVCNHSFSSNHALTAHTNHVHLKSKKYECSTCHFSTFIPFVFERHCKTCHDHPKSKIIKCETCGRCFARKQNLVKHMKIHATNRAPCSTCNFSFETKELLKRHEAIHRPCQICGLTFKFRKSREAHMRRHLKGGSNKN